jgi:surfactin synthase thioesterase subunit
MLISGASSGGGTGGLPTLVIHGEHDTQVSASGAHAFAGRTHATYAGFDGGHFVLLTRREETRDAIARWLKQHQ